MSSSAADPLAVPELEGPVGVHAKEVSRVVLLQRRVGWSRLTLGPFLVLYVLLMAVVAQQYISNG